jgi:CTP:phosphocholine cytidylyltransferase-like protein
MSNKVTTPASCQTAVSGSISFKEQMKQDIIPFVERMIEKEKQHLYWLERKNAPKEFIERSKLHLNHFRQRHKEYIEYADGL